MKLLSSFFKIIKDNRKAYIMINLVYYGLVAVGMVYVSFNPALQQTLINAVGASFNEGPLSAVGGAYGSGNVVQAMLLTFVVNLFAGSLLVITLPSLVIPFFGLLMGIYRAVLWGLLLSPAEPTLALAMIPHSLTLLLEGQAYILAIFAAYLLWRNFFWPRSAGLESRGKGYLLGLKQTGILYIGVVLLLVVAAVYEALEVIYLVPLMF